MSRPIVAAAAAFVVACIAATGSAVLRARSLQATADSAAIVAADSAAAVTAAAAEVSHDADTVHDVADTAHRDSLPMVAGGTSPISLTPTPTVPPSEAQPVAAPAERAATPHVQAPASAPTNRAEPIAGAIRPRTQDSVPETALAREGRLAKLFSAMSPRDAAKVFERMSDADVISILGALPDRRAGEILALMPPERSAGIARAVLARASGGSR